MRTTFRSFTVAVAASAALVAAACGTGDDGSSTASSSPSGEAADTSAAAAGGFPVELTTDAGPVTIEAQPTAIVSLSPTGTEMLFAIGAGGQVKAVDDQSNHPPEAPVSDLSGYTPNVEAIVGMDPDLVVASDAAPDVVDGLAKAAVPLLVLPAAVTIEDSYEQLELLGRATGQTGGAEKVVQDMRTRIDELVAGLPERPQPLTYYHELDDTLYSATSETFIGSLYAMIGLENVADGADGDGSGYPQLSVEYLLQADPDLIFLADVKCCDQNAETVAARPGWSALTAVRTGAVVELDDDIASRWGPRVVDQLETVAAAVAELPVTNS
ncbi:MAG: ABC transporter substrate-binding protein [Acidimicrobiales bacterium]